MEHIKVQQVKPIVIQLQKVMLQAQDLLHTMHAELVNTLQAQVHADVALALQEPIRLAVLIQDVQHVPADTSRQQEPTHAVFALGEQKR